jgi:transcriptional regulator with XRE-family HTH domain
MDLPSFLDTRRLIVLKSLAQVAAECHIPPAELARYEAGKCLPPPALLPRLAVALEMGPRTLARMVKESQAGGFTHYCGKRRSNGAFIVWRETAKKRLVAKLHAAQAELRRQMHPPTLVVGEWLQRVTLGYYQYHAIPGNLNRLCLLRHGLRLLWRRVLVRRRQKRQMPWERLNPLLDRWIPVPRVLASLSHRTLPR